MSLTGTLSAGAMLALCLSAPHAQDINALLASFKQADAEQREELAKQFAGVVNTADIAILQAAVPAVLTALKDEPAPVKKSLLTGLARIALRVTDEAALKPALKPLKATKKSKSSCVKCHGASALGCVATAMKEQDVETVRYSLNMMIKGMKGKGGHSVMGTVRQFCRIAPRVRDPEIRKAAAGILVKLTKSKLKEARPVAEKALAQMEATEPAEGKGAEEADETETAEEEEAEAEAEAE